MYPPMFAQPWLVLIIPVHSPVLGVHVRWPHIAGWLVGRCFGSAAFDWLLALTRTAPVVNQSFSFLMLLLVGLGTNTPECDWISGVLVLLFFYGLGGGPTTTGPDR